MKKLIIPIGILVASGSAYAQTTVPSSSENYVYTKVHLSDPSESVQKQVETVQYFDGLGRPKQVVNVKASPLGKDVVTRIDYDGFGRQALDYLPVPQSGTSNGAIIADPLANVLNTPYGSEKIYSEKVLENSPLNRIQQQIQVGTDWANKPVRFDYEANTAADNVRNYQTTTTWDATNKMFVSSVQTSAFFQAAKLYKNTVTDEDGNKTIEFTNGRGQTLLIRKVLSATENADTYYVYNEYNQLAYVIPPLASVSGSTLQTTLDNLCYQYRYDSKYKLVEKRLPGKGWEYMVYDKADRLVLTQDANMKVQNNWLMTKYDQFGRVAVTGIMNSGGDRITWQNIVNDLVIIESRDTTGFTKNGMNIYYSNTYFTSSITAILSVNYYDTYPAYSFNPAFPSTIFGKPILTDNPATTGKSTKDLPVMTLVKNIEDDNWTKNYSYYDSKGRPIGSYSINYLGGNGYTRTETELDFAGTAKQTKTYHKRLGSDTEKVITETFTYDHQNRLLVHKHKVDSNTEEILSQNTYNELSQLTNKKVGGTVASTPLQSIDYAYNICGWMTKINDPGNLGNDLFGYKINYNQVEGLETPNSDYTDLKVKPKYNGNIAEVSWKTSTVTNDNIRRYGYVYDGLNRLLAGFYQKDTNPSAKEYFEKMDYDLNGNITSLKRSQGALTGSSTAMTIDNLSYDYTGYGNKIKTVTDLSGQYSGYPDVSGNIIGYDLNGNMTDQKDKGILDIDYNHLNLPDKLTFNESYLVRDFFGDQIRNVTTKYIYRADGTKLSKVYTYGITRNNSEAATTTDYLDGFQYEGNGATNAIVSPVLKFVPTAEGYFNFENNKYIYNYTDHLGNVRLSYMNNGSGIQVVEENNYYPFGLKHSGYNGLSGNPSYQYKYNSKELQQETGMYDYGARFYMPDIGRWSVIDPLSEKGHNFSPYNYAINNPIRFIDPDGLWISITDGDNQYRYSNGQTQHQVDGKWVAIDKNVTLSDNVIGIVAGLSALESGGDAGKDLVSYFDNDKHDVNIMYDKGNAGDAGMDSSGLIKIDPKASAKTPTTNGLVDSPFFVSLGHELGHKRDENIFYPKGGWFGVSRGEIFASHIENMIRAENGLPLRTSYSKNPKVFGGLDLQTVLIDCAGSSFYYRSANTPFEYNGRNGNEGEDRANAARSVYGTADSSVLKGRYNYYDNVKRTKKK